VVIVMTTNAGGRSVAEDFHRLHVEQQAGDELADIKRIFTPEFRNRLDAVISFKALDTQVILQVVRQVPHATLKASCHEKKVEWCSPTLCAHGLPKRASTLDGARPMARLIQDSIRAAWPTSCSLAACCMVAR